MLEPKLFFNTCLLFFLLQQLVVKAVSLAIARDGASGGVVRTVIVRLFTSIKFAFSNFFTDTHASETGWLYMLFLSFLSSYY